MAARIGGSDGRLRGRYRLYAYAGNGRSGGAVFDVTCKASSRAGQCPSYLAEKERG